MSFIGKLPGSLQSASSHFSIEVLANDIQPQIDAALMRHDKHRQRASKLSPRLTVWLILTLALRRELGYRNLLNWLMSGLRSLGWSIPRNAVAEGAITHARKRIDTEVIRDLFVASKSLILQPNADFHGLLSVAIDGTTLTMPDTPGNAERFGRAGNGRSTAAFPQTRLVALAGVATQAVFDVAFGAYCGKGTGEKTLGMRLVQQNARAGLLFLLDRGFWCFGLLNAIVAKHAAFLIRVPDHVKIRRIRGSSLQDGSYYASIVGKIVVGLHPDGRRMWQEVPLKIRVIDYQIRGFHRTRLATSVLDPTITAREIVAHYHRRWEVELAYDSIKTHQCATKTGQSRTILRSKTPQLIEQEIYAMLALYNMLRHLINKAAAKHGLDPLAVSFVDTLCAVIDAIPGLQRAPPERLRFLYDQLLDDIAACAMKRRRRKRAYPRVVKVKMSSFRLKRSGHGEKKQDFEAQTRILSKVRRCA